MNSVYQAVFPPPPRENLGTRLGVPELQGRVIAN